jgi:YD repeat-containing protein
MAERDEVDRLPGQILRGKSPDELLGRDGVVKPGFKWVLQQTRLSPGGWVVAGDLREDNGEREQETPPGVLGDLVHPAKARRGSGVIEDRAALAYRWASCSLRRNGAGVPQKIQAPDGHETMLALTDGWLTKVFDPGGSATSLAYRGDGLLDSLTDANGHASEFDKGLLHQTRHTFACR